jgi:hypothetical protein
MQVLAGLLVVTLLQDKPKVDQAQVDAAIDKGCKYLLTQYGMFTNPMQMTWEPTSPGSKRHNLIPIGVLTLKHGGVDENDPTFQKMLQKMLADPIETTYMAAVQAMALQKIDAEKYQHRIAQCAQYLIDNQCKNGQWCYGHLTDVGGIPAPKEETVGGGSGKFSTGGKKGPEEAPKKVKRIYLTRKAQSSCAQGDNSNSQYAALGLRAVIECHIVLPQETLTAALQYWERSQRPDGGWTYGQPDMLNGMKINDPFSVKTSYGSMTMGGYSAVAIYKYLLKQDFRRDPRILAAADWLAKNWKIEENPGNPKYYHYYYLYAIERGGDLTGHEKFGGHDWYFEGARWLIANQAANGSWKSPSVEPEQVEAVSTCFAVLFLKRATVPLIKTEAAPKK